MKLLSILSMLKAAMRFLRNSLIAGLLRATPPLVGRLRYEDSFYGGRDGRGPKVCLLMPLDPDVTDPLVQLFSTGIKIEPRGEQLAQSRLGRRRWLRRRLAVKGVSDDRRGGRAVRLSTCWSSVASGGAVGSGGRRRGGRDRRGSGRIRRSRAFGGWQHRAHPWRICGARALRAPG